MTELAAALWIAFAVAMAMGIGAIGVHAVYDLREMRVLDPRSGRELQVGDRVEYGDGEAVTLLDVKPGLVWARARVKLEMRDYDDEAAGMPPRMVTTEEWVDLQVRWIHPDYFMQWVAFLPG